MTDELIGKKIGGYEILDLIGRGGMATVYRAHQISMNRVVALKVLPRQFLNDDTYLQRFNREVKIIAQLEHRNIVPVHDYGEHEGQPYIALRYMSGGSVDDLLDTGPLPIEQILSIMLQIAPALDYAHSKNVLHRDIKPSNVLLDDDGGAYLTDFGIARLLGDNSGFGKLTTQGVVGTPAYMSPEQAQGHELDNRSDVYSLGVMLFEMATGRRPFESETPYSIAIMQVTQQPPAPRTINPNIAPAVEQVIYRAMSKRPADRYPDAWSLAQALEQAADLELPAVSMIDTQPGGIALPAQPLTPPPVPQYNGGQSSGLNAPVQRRRPRRINSLWLSAAVGALIGCGLLAFMVVIAAFVISNTELEETPTALAATAPPTEALNDEAGSEGSGTGQALPSLVLTPLVTPDNTPEVIQRENLPEATILYFALREGNYDIYQLDLRASEERRLTNDSAVDIYPQVSPTGDTIVFVSNRDGDHDLYLMDTNGQNVRQLTLNDVIDRIPAWSPDGQWIIFSSDTRGDGSHDLYQIRPDGSDLTLLYTNGQRNSHPRWSPDDRYIIFTGGVPSQELTWEVMRLDRRDNSLAALTNNNVSDSSAVLTPNGTILYISDGEGGGAIYQMTVDGDERTLVFDGPGREWGAQFSQDGRYLLFSTTQNNDDYLFLYDLTTERVQQIISANGSYPSWLTYDGGET